MSENPAGLCLYSKPEHKAVAFGPISGVDEFEASKKNKAYLENIHRVEQDKEDQKRARQEAEEHSLGRSDTRGRI